MANTGPKAPAGAASGMRPQDVAGLLGRYQGPEPFAVVPFVINSAPFMPRNINLSRPLASIEIEWRGRFVIGTADFTTVGAEAPQNIIQRIRLTGTHRLFNQLVPIDISGASAFAWARVYTGQGNPLLLNATRQAELSSPMASQGLVVTQGTYDLEVHYKIPLGPLLGPAARIRSTIPYLYLPQDWADSLQLQLFFGDMSAYGTPAVTSTGTFTAFGSGAGSPQVDVSLNYAILGPLANRVRSAVVIRNEQLLTAPVITTGSQVLIQQLQKQRTTNILVKSGTLASLRITPGVTVYATLSDLILDRTQVVVDNKPIRNNGNNRQAKQSAGACFETQAPQGYLPLTFIDSLTPMTMFRGDRIPGGSAFNLVSDVVGAATNAVSITQEQVFSAAP